jgi:hypothetical protein
MVLSPTPLLVCVVDGSRTSTGTSTYQSTFPSSYQSACAGTDSRADPNSFGRFSLPGFRIVATVVFVSFRRRRKSSNQHTNSQNQRNEAQPHGLFHGSLLLRACDNGNANQ